MSREVSVPMMPSANASGMETMPGLASGKKAKSAPGIIAVLLPDTAGENTISTMVEIRPPYMLHSAPRVLNRFQYSEYSDRRQVGRGRHGECQRDQERHVLTVGEDAQPDREHAQHDRGDTRDPHLLVLGHLVRLEHRGIDVVGERGRRRDGQAGHHREDRRERHRGDDPEQDHPAEFERQQRGRGVHAAGRPENPVRTDQGGRAVTRAPG